MVNPFSRGGSDLPYISVLYLSPMLERRAYGFVIACVAHELAHIALGHSVFQTAKENPAQEAAAWKLVDAWGFADEAKQHTAAWKAYWTRDASTEERLRSERTKTTA
jgi:hypothetical protein